jgi:hypothetical protein
MRGKAREKQPGEEEHSFGRIIRIGFGIFGIVVTLISAMFVAMAVVDLITGDNVKTARGTLVGLLVLFTGSTIWGLYLTLKSFGWRLPRPHWRAEQAKEQEVLTYANSVGGRVTVPEVAVHCQLSIEESEEILNEFAAHHAAELLITDDGTTVYDFNFLSDKEKAQAREFG